MTTVFTRSESGTLSYIGRINYAYQDRYLFEFLLRSDASTKFAPENYWGTFPAISAGWVISEEPWFQNSKVGKWIDFLKIRASWGLTGRDNLAAWQWMQVYAQDANRGPVFGTGVGNDSKNRITINKNNSAINEDVHWDKSYKTNIGIDLQVLRKRLAINVDYYYEKNREMLMNLAQNVPSTVGTQSASTNLGEMDNWGWELGITWRDKIGKDFKYRIGINTGYHDNEVLVMDFKDPKNIYRQIVQGQPYRHRQLGYAVHRHVPFVPGHRGILRQVQHHQLYGYDEGQGTSRYAHLQGCPWCLQSRDEDLRRS